MGKLNLLKAVGTVAHRVGFVLKKHGPEILIFGGTAGVVSGTVMACCATTKLNGIVEDAKDQVSEIHAQAEDENGNLPDIQRKKMLTRVYVGTGLQILRLYAPSAIVTGASLAAILTSHKIMRGRYMGLASAYAIVDKSFKEYQGRVIERFGEELHKELKYGVKTKEIDEIVVEEDGTQTINKKTVNVIEKRSPSEFAFFFDEYCEGWTKNAEANKKFLIDVQNWANDKLREQRHLFLNELHDMLGAPRTRAGNEVGWVYDPDGICCGDNYVNLRIFDQCGIECYDERKRAFLHGHERSVLIDPNVDGPILAMLP